MHPPSSTESLQLSFLCPCLCLCQCLSARCQRQRKEGRDAASVHKLLSPKHCLLWKQTVRHPPTPVGTRSLSLPCSYLSVSLCLFVSVSQLVSAIAKGEDVVPVHLSPQKSSAVQTYAIFAYPGVYASAVLPVPICFCHCTCLCKPAVQRQRKGRERGIRGMGAETRHGLCSPFSPNIVAQVDNIMSSHARRYASVAPCMSLCLYMSVSVSQLVRDSEGWRKNKGRGEVGAGVWGGGGRVSGAGGGRGWYTTLPQLNFSPLALPLILEDSAMSAHPSRYASAVYVNSVSLSVFFFFFWLCQPADQGNGSELPKHRLPLHPSIFAGEFGLRFLCL